MSEEMYLYKNLLTSAI